MKSTSTKSQDPPKKEKSASALRCHFFKLLKIKAKKLKLILSSQQISYLQSVRVIPHTSSVDTKIIAAIKSAVNAETVVVCFSKALSDVSFNTRLLILELLMVLKRVD